MFHYPHRQNEDALQEQCIWVMHLQYPEYEHLLHHSPNGGSRNPIEGLKFKRMGTRAGFPDLVLCVPAGGFHALFIELKTEKGRFEDSQKIMLEELSKQHYFCVCVRSVDEFKMAVKTYLQMRIDNQILGAVMMADEAKRPALSYAIIQYLTTGKYDHDDAIDDAMRLIVLPRLDLSKKRAAAGAKGGKNRFANSIANSIALSKNQAKPKKKRESNTKRKEEYIYKNISPNGEIQKEPQDGSSLSLNPDYLSFIEWLKENTPNAIKYMDIPKEKEFLKLKAKYKTSEIIDKLQALENNPEYYNPKGNKRGHSSIYLTINNWIKRDEKRC